MANQRLDSTRAVCIPRPCTNERHFRWAIHFRASTQLRCDVLQKQLDETLIARRDDDSPGLDTKPWWQEQQKQWDHLQERRKRRTVEDAMAAHVPVTPTEAAEVAVSRNGERQLLGRASTWLATINVMVSSDVYPLNARLRRGESLEHVTGALLDYYGYGTLKEFDTDAREMFTDLDAELLLDEPVRLYRGIGLPLQDEYQPVDFWGLSAHLRDGIPLDVQPLVDTGYGFATPLEDIAACFDGQDSLLGKVCDPVMLVLEVRRGICIPDPAHRSKELTGLTATEPLLKNSIGQVLLPPDSEWRVIESTPATAQGCARISLSQSA
ncbi:hypothetical protein [Pseudoclavibacter sp. AY1H1]|uniref:hypothetical protein n=1 Tax=Pseudoclavibacter sp. AY1H1 TaxID=2080584 RepID=UPI000CE76405|nr:hypothetical protein [Pseudoclavibacter sp. AY1H1]PPF32673.1 hypothetical protein C5E05_19405 [Pseudoclavibacter sp. AY1H1]